MKRLFDTVWHKALRRPYALAIDDSGGTGKPLVLLHGLAQSGARWQPLAKLMEGRRWRVVAPDLLGFGDSPKPDWSSYSVQEHARMVLHTLQRAGVTGRMTLVGHSMGGLVAAHIAAKHPERVARLVLYEPPLLVDDPEYRKHTRQRNWYFALYEYVASHRQLTFLRQQMLWRLVRRLSGLHLSEEEWPAFERSLRNTIMSQTAYDELKHISIPTDIVHGRLDVVVPRAEIKDMFAHNPQVTLHIVNDIHNVTPRSAKYLARLLDGEL